jgi:hypothetical protein
MAGSKTPFTACRVVSTCSTLILICILIFHNHILASIDNLQSSVASPKLLADSAPPDRSPQTPSSPHEFFSFVGDDPTGWAARRLPDNGGFIDTKYNNTFTLQVGISMFHALHCVERIRGKILANGDEDMRTHHDPQNPLDDDPKERRFHLLHCLDYIIQVLSLFVVDYVLLTYKGHNVRRRFHAGVCSPAL